MLEDPSFDASVAHSPLSAPSLQLKLLEPFAALEMAAMVVTNPLLRLIGRGDRTPVLVLPGFSADDASTVALRSLLRSWGYWAHGWGVGRNLGPTRQTIDAVRDRLDALYERHQRRVVLIGESGGGVFARHLAREAPAKVRQVITLAAPIQMVAGDESAASVLVHRLERSFDPEFRRLADYQRGVLPVPSTSIYTRTDGVVRWQVCLDVMDDRHENVEVHATHSGLALNPAAVYVIADRLRQPEDDWRPFRAAPVLRRLYPRPASWDPDRHHRDVTAATA